MKPPLLRIRVKDGFTIFTKVELNGQPFEYVTRLSFDTGESMDGMVKCRMEFYADIDIEAGGAAIELVPQKRGRE